MKGGDKMKQKRRLSSYGPLVSTIGYGAMVFEGYYGIVFDPKETGTEVVLRPEILEKISRLAEPGLAQGQTLL